MSACIEPQALRLSARPRELQLSRPLLSTVAKTAGQSRANEPSIGTYRLIVVISVPNNPIKYPAIILPCQSELK